MKEKILRTIFNQYHELFLDFFVEEYTGNIPKDKKEPAMKFLGRGRDLLETWALFQIYILQRRIKTTPKEIDITTGMILMMKLLLAQVTQEPKAVPIEMGSPEEKKEDPIDQAEDAIRGLREHFGFSKKK